MKYNPDIHHRRSIRLRNFDYASTGYYFVTICTNGREPTFGEGAVSDIVQDTWEGLPERFPVVKLDEFVIMSDHLHGILVLRSSGVVDLSRVIRVLKSISAIAINRLLDRHERPVWQRNYYERIIRNDRELNAVRDYIRANPANAHCHSGEHNVVATSGRS